MTGTDVGAGFDYAAHGLLPPPARPRLPGAPQTVAEVLDPVLAEEPEREALVGRHGRLSYAGLDSAADRAAGALAALGVGPGDRVAVSLPNDVGIVVAFLGCMRLGAVWVGVNRALAPPEKAHVLRDCEARVWLAEAAALAALAAERETLPALRHALAADPADPASDWARACAEASAGRPRVAIDPFAPAAIAYTSGTTGLPKGAVHSQHNLLLPGAVARETGSFAPDERQGVLLPLTILNLMVLVPLVAFQVGSACVAMDRIDPLGVAAWVREECVASFAAPPTVLLDLLTHPDVKPADLASLRRPEVGGADCPDRLRTLYRERFGAGVSIGYGLTEAPTAVARAAGDDPPLPGLCGRALPQVELAILDPEGRALPPGEVGEICVGPASSGPFAGSYTPMLGYWRRPEATAEALRGGWLWTGDLGELDREGRLFIRGRRKELILRGGANVYPAEVERVLATAPGVAACAVAGRPDPRLGERVVAWVVPAPGAARDAEALRTHLVARLARYKVPSELVFVETLPRNAMGKVTKHALRLPGEEGA